MINDITKKELEKLYIEDELSSRKIATLLGIKSHKTILCLLKNFGIKAKSKKVDISGRRNGKLVAISPSQKPGKVVFWNCKCDCGRLLVIKSGDFWYRNSCMDCAAKDRICNLAGQRFGKLEVVGLAYTKRFAYWNCKCDCGKSKVMRSDVIKNAKSCGCITKEIDLVGKRFGMIVVLSKKENITKNRIYWECRCDCGNIFSISGSNLGEDRTFSCGCINAKQETKLVNLIISILSPKFTVRRHYRPSWLFNKRTGGQQHLDIVIMKKGTECPVCALEYNGEQHYFPVCFGGISTDLAKKSLKETKKADRRKRRLAAQNKIPLIIIGYKKQISERIVKSATRHLNLSLWK